MKRSGFLSEDAAAADPFDELDDAGTSAAAETAVAAVAVSHLPHHVVDAVVGYWDCWYCCMDD